MTDPTPADPGSLSVRNDVKGTPCLISESELIAEMNYSDSNWLAHAAWLVRASNNHAALVGALTQLHAECCAAGFDDNINYEWPKVMEQAHAALDNIKAEKPA